MTNVLIIDDNLDDREWLIDLLQSEGRFAITACAFGAEGLRHVQEHRFDCVLLDWRLNGEDGVTFVAALKSSSLSLPVILLMGRGKEDVVAQSIKAGAAGYLIKQDLNTSCLRATIENAVSRTVLEAKIADQEPQRQRFLAKLVHDLHAPLRNVRQLGQMASEEARRGNIEELQGLLSSLSSVASGATDLITMLEAYARLDGEVAFKDSSLTEAAKAARDNLAVIIAERQAEVVIHDLPFVHGHAPQLTQLFQHLIGNALKYNESNPPKILIKIENGSIVVRDNGIGIPRKHLKEIFEPLNRLWGFDQYKGTGLGLAICHKIVERHKGSISCSSTEGEGSTFHIRFVIR